MRPWDQLPCTLLPSQCEQKGCASLLGQSSWEARVASPLSLPAGCWHLKEDSRASISLGLPPTRPTLNCTGEREIRLYYVYSLSIWDLYVIATGLFSLGGRLLFTPTSHIFWGHPNASTLLRWSCVLHVIQVFDQIHLIKTSSKNHPLDTYIVYILIHLHRVRSVFQSLPWQIFIQYLTSDAKFLPAWSQDNWRGEEVIFSWLDSLGQTIHLGHTPVGARVYVNWPTGSH